MIRAAFPKVSIMPVSDSHSDEQWSRNLDDRIDDFVVARPVGRHLRQP